MTDNSPANRRSLVRTFSLVLSISLLFVSAVAYLFSYNFALHQANKELQHKASDYFDEIKTVLKKPLWNFDTHAVEIIAEAHLSNMHLNTLVIQDSNGEIIYSHTRNEDPSALTLSSQIIYQDTPVGYIQYSISTLYLQELRQGLLWSYLVNIIAIMFAIMLVSGIFIRKILLTTFNGFSQDVRDFARGNGLALERRDLYSEFNSLVDALYKLADDKTQANTSKQEAITLRERIIESSPVGIAVYDECGNCITVNDALCRTLGDSKASVLALNYNQIDNWKDHLFHTAVSSAILEQTTQHFEMAINNIANERVILDCTITPIYSNSTNHLLFMINNITQRKAEELELAAYRSKLEQIIEERTNELIETQNELIHRERLSTVGQLTGGIAHDFNNILAIISGFNDLIRAHADLHNNDKLAHFSSEIGTACHRATTLVSQLLTFCRGSDSDAEILDITPIISESVHLLRQTTASSIEFKTSLVENLPAISANATQIHQMVMNLCINARDAIADTGSILLSTHITTINNTFCDSCRHHFSGNFVELRVDDSGHGINEDNLAFIFDPFFTTKAIGKGSGMGLSVIHGLLHKYGGHILVESSKSGSSFRLLFPISDQLPELVDSHSTSESQLVQASPRGNILVVDDERSIADYLYDLLTMHGYTVTTTTDSTKALSLLQVSSENFDLLITDQTMPKLSGLDLAQSLYDFNPTLPVIICSGYHPSLDSMQQPHFGIRATLHKPVNSAELLQTIQEQLYSSHPAEL
ncbi:MAG: response regulator [Chromatiales bacterium]|nr:response regulator [Chromatiales bacterium]